MFTRRGKYVVKKLPAGTVVGTATTLLDAADVAMEDARGGPGRYVIEQPPVEVDVSKAYGVLALTDGGTAPTPPDVPGDVTVLSVGVSDAALECAAVADATSYQWFLSGAPHSVTTDPAVLIGGLAPSTAYTVQVAALRDGVSSANSAPVSFTTESLAPPVWQAVPAQALTVGVVFDVDLAGYVSSPGGDTPSLSLVSGALPAGLSIVGVRITGTPTTVETQTPVIRATAVGGTADSAAITFESLNADTTAPAAPTNFSAAGYSSSQVRLSWTNPADDATVAGERKSGFLGIDIYRDGVKIDRVLATATTPEEYLAETTVTALWKVRSVDQSFNKGAFTPELSAGPLAQSTAPGVPVSVAAVRNSSTSATVTWAAGSGPAPTSYQVWMALSLNGTYSQVASPAGTSHTQTTGFTGSQVPYFYVVAVRGAETSAPSAKVSATAGVLTPIVDSDFEVGEFLPTTGSLPPGTESTGWRLLSGPNKGSTPSDERTWKYDAFDHCRDDLLHSHAPTNDRPCQLVTTRAREGTRSVRTQVTFHTGSATFPDHNDDAFHAGAEFHHKGGDLNDAEAHRNEVSHAGADVNIGTEYWTGVSLFLPGPNDPFGDPATEAVSFWGSYRYPFQLHGPTGGGNPVLYVATSHGWSQQQVVTHPAGAPIVRFARGSQTYNLPSNSADTLLVEWSAPTSGPAPTGYRVYRSRRASGPFDPVATTGATAAEMRYTESGLGTSSSDWSTAYVYIRAVYGPDSLGPASLVCPAPRDWLGIGKKAYDSSSGTLVDIPGSQQNYGIAPISGYVGQWLDVVLHYLPSVTNTGYLEAWFNGAKVLSLFDISLGELRPGYVNYWKGGVYHGSLTSAGPGKNYVPPDWPKRFSVYMDAVRHWRRAGGLTAAQWKAVGGSSTADAGYIAVAPRGVPG